MPIILFLLFIIVPIIEIAVIIKVGGLIGVLPTIAIMIGMAVAGSWLIRSQSRVALARAAEQMRGGKPPVDQVIDGFGILVAGLLMLTPGFLSDAFGLLLLVPPVRRRIARWLFAAFARNADIKVGGFRFETARQRPADESRQRPPGAPTTIDGEFTRVDDETRKPTGPSPWQRGGDER